MYTQKRIYNIIYRDRESERDGERERGAETERARARHSQASESTVNRPPTRIFQLLNPSEIESNSYPKTLSRHMV